MPPDYEWSYLSRGGSTHARTRRSTGIDHISRCGVGPAWFDPAGWLGTGNQFEYDTAAILPRCRRCVMLLEHDAG